MRRIIIACDGTGQSATRGQLKPSSNVARFCHALATDFQPTPANSTPAQQLVFYQSGVGTTAGGFVHDTVSKGTGLGIDDNILDAYVFIMNNYLPDDEIFIFGFSRGAFTARVLAGFIVKLGIFRASRSWELKVAFKAYRTSEAEWEKYLEALHKEIATDVQDNKEPRTQAAKIKVVGCWDTVGSVGLPYIKPAYEYVTGSSGVYDASLLGGPSHKNFSTIENAFHALALDEYRRPFSPTLWYLPKDAEGTNLQQCWFPGVHTNVGGGYADSALAEITLAWMIERCQHFLAFHPKYLDLVVKLHQHPDRKDRSRETEMDKWDEGYKGWGNGRLYDSYKASLYTVQLQGWKYRRPGEYGAKDGASGRSVSTNEKIHASVRERYMNEKIKPEWRPEALSGFKPNQKASGKWEWVRLDKNNQPGLVLDEDDFKEEKTTFEAQLRYPQPELRASG